MAEIIRGKRPEPERLHRGRSRFKGDKKQLWMDRLESKQQARTDRYTEKEGRIEKANEHASENISRDKFDRAWKDNPGMRSNLMSKLKKGELDSLK